MSILTKISFFNFRLQEDDLYSKLPLLTHQALAHTHLISFLLGGNVRTFLGQVMLLMDK